MDSSPRLTLNDHLRVAARLWCEQNMDDVATLSQSYATSSNGYIGLAEQIMCEVMAEVYARHLEGLTPDDPLPDGWAVYHLVGHDERILYIGMTGRPAQRLSSHRREFGAHLCRVEWYPCENRVEAYELEGERIALHRPPFNVARVPQ